MTQKKINVFFTKSIVNKALVLFFLFFFNVNGTFAQIAQVGATQTAYVGSDTQLVLTKPPGVAVGDVMIINLAKNSDSTNPTLAGWTSIHSGLGGSNSRRGSIFYRIVDGTEGANFTITLGGTARAEGAIVAFTGVDLTSPFDVTPGSITTPSDFGNNVAGITAVTTVTPNSLVLMFGMSVSASNNGNTNNTARSFSSYTGTTPALTEIYDVLGTNTVSVGMASAFKTTTGTTNTGTITMSGNAYLGGVIIALRPLLKQYRSVATGNWNSTSTWEQSRTNGATWEAATTTPVSTDGLATIQSPHIVTLTTAETASSIVVNGTLDLATNTLTGSGLGSLSVSNTGSLKIGGLSNTPSGYVTITLNTTSTVEYYYAGNQTISGINYGNLILSGSGTKTLTTTGAITANALTVGANTNLLLNGNNSLTPVSATVNGTLTVGNTASLVKGTGVLSFNSGSTYNHNRSGGTIPTATWNAASTCLISAATAAPSGLTQAFGNFTWNCAAQTADISLAGNLTTVNGNLSVISTGSGSLRLVNSLGNADLSTNVAGNLIQTGGTFYVYGNYNSPNNWGFIFTLNIGGAFSQSGGVFNVNGSTENPVASAIINLTGSLTMSLGTLTETGNGPSIVNFNSSSTQVFSKTGGTVSNTINFTVNSGATLDMGTSILTGSGAFNLASGAGIITAHSQGLSTTGSTGSVQVTGTRTYNSGANYTYNGTVNQGTGNGLTGANNLTINNVAGVTLSAVTSVSGILTLANGKLVTTTNLLSVTNEATSAIVGGSSTAYIDGPLKRTLPISLGSGSTYNYPIGSGAKYLPFSLVNPTTTATSSPTVQVRAYTGSTGGTVDATLDSISTTEYWMLTPTANVTNTSVSMNRTTAISPLDVIAGKTLSNGTNIPYGGTVGVNGITNSNTVAIGNIDARYFVFGKRKPGIFSTVTTLSGFTYKENLGPSTIQSFTVSGYSLTTNLKLEMLRGNYELSTSNAPSFVGSGVLYLPVVNGVVSPTTIYIRLKAGLAEKALITDSVSISSSGYTSKIVNCSGSVTTPAKLITSPATLTMSNYTFGGGPSSAQSFVFSGTLLNGNVTVTPPAGFEIATSAGGAYQSTAFTYTPSSGTLGNTTLWARMKSGLGVGTHTGNIVVASSGAVSKNITCSGTVNLGATLTNSTSFLGAFSYAFGGGPSDAQSFVITGQNLTGNIVVTPPSADFAISRTREGTYQTSALTITASGSFSDSIFVKMIGGLNAGSYGPSSITVASNGAVTKSVACSGQVFAVATAAIKTSTSSVSGFGYKYAATNPIGVESGGPSNPQSFVVTGVSLSSDIVVQAPDSFEVSTSVNGSYFNSLTLVRTGSKVSPKTVYVRLKKSLPVGIYSGSINLISGMSTSTTVLCNAGKVYASPLITVTGEGDYCLGSTINLGSSGEDIQNRYWEGPNNYYSILQNPTLTTNATADLSGNYIVTGNVVVGGNLIFNGSFELGNVGFGSAYGYPQTPFTQTGTSTSLQSEGKYAITTTGSVVHDNFNSVADKNIDGTMQMVVNGNTTAGAVVWSQNVAVLPNSDYEFSYWLQTVVNGVDGAPSKLQLYVNGVAAGPVYTANPNSGNWAQYLYNTNANANTMLNLELINQTTSAGGNDFALDSITFRQVLIAKDTVPVAVGSPLPVSVSLVASQNPVNAGAPVTYTATPVNGGTAPTYQWFVNNSPVSAASGSTYTYFPSSGDLIKCVVVSSLSCVTDNPATSNTVTQVVNVVANPNYWYGKISTDWGTAANWTDNRVPAAGEDVEYATMENTDSIAVRDLYVDTVRTIGNLINATTQRLVIPAGKSLSVNNSITTNNNVNTIYIQSSSTLPTGTLIFNNVQNYPVSATVEMYSSASWDLTRPVNQKYNWQFFGIPLRSVVAVPTLTGSYVRRYLETGTTISNHWQQLSDESVLSPFYTYEICQKEPKIYTFKGQLVNSNFNSGQLAKTVGAIYPGQHMFANPYTAGMDIRQIQFGSDMDSTVYMYHTGSFGSWSSAAAGKVGENAGQYVSVPQNKAGTSTIPRQVPSMGSMLIRLKPTVSTSTANCYVNFNYASLVMKNTDLLRAPSAKNDIQSVAVNTRIDVTGNNTQDKMWIFSDDSCSRGFDNGDDGIKILGTALQPQIYAVEADGNYQINAVSDMNNTTIAFQAGEDTEYTLTFNHEFAETKYEKIYLHDLVENTILNITENGSIYKFTATSTPNAVNRFRIITKSIGEESTTQSNVKLFVAEQSIYVQNFSDFDGTVYLYDVTGRLHGTTRISPNGVVFFPAKAYNAYIVKTVLLNETVTQKIVLK